MIGEIDSVLQHLSAAQKEQGLRAMPSAQALTCQSFVPPGELGPYLEKSCAPQRRLRHTFLHAWRSTSPGPTKISNDSDG